MDCCWVCPPPMMQWTATEFTQMPPPLQSQQGCNWLLLGQTAWAQPGSSKYTVHSPIKGQQPGSTHTCNSHALLVLILVAQPSPVWFLLLQALQVPGGAAGEALHGHGHVFLSDEQCFDECLGSLPEVFYGHLVSKKKGGRVHSPCGSQSTWVSIRYHHSLLFRPREYGTEI